MERDRRSRRVPPELRRKRISLDARELGETQTGHAGALPWGRPGRQTNRRVRVAGDTAGGHPRRNAIVGLMKLVLASASPRRRELLDAIGLGFEVRPVDLDEAAVAGSLPPLDAAAAVATAKVRATDGTNRIVLAADTM